MPRKAAKKTTSSPATHVVPRERLEFKQILAINPNYFGNLEKTPFKPVKKIIGNTNYEQVTCVGYNPALSLLEATVQIKRPGGYNGTLCTPGSTEYVRFFVDYGSGWVDAGLASFNAHDIPNSLDCAKEPDKPLSYDVTLPLNPPRNFCIFPLLPRVRAILSWQVAPPAGNANWPPAWGNVLNDHIQIKPRFLWFGDVLEALPKDALKKLPPLVEEAKPFPIPLPDPPPLTLPELAQLYQAKKGGKAAAVEPHRFGLAHVQSAIATGSQEALLAANAEWKAIDVDLAGVIAALNQTRPDVSYEELECLGLEYNLDRLVATFRVKKPGGYSGDPCSAGSQEYVAFWADWNDTCDWTYVGTVAVNVHDYSTIPAGGVSV